MGNTLFALDHNGFLAKLGKMRMITISLIHWHAIALMPDDRKDGRDMLLWNGDAEVGAWFDDGFEGAGWAATRDVLPIEKVTHWADINSPE
ncbi:hypothetical protein Q4F19_08615 [Sphingomonas sp. BIUV-7]|uniref:DUF551 domain-containing protein n=1 Tax=Sphingomonas natans TaxID=3063330 RepID=A0ABT8Y802_9SPHN|nr:hypothetical protein [Sphingomonas sp. BIUV-7]MDO6414439.1 hypothetical protein [Sphingomonas sp. BIUV-7]